MKKTYVVLAIAVSCVSLLPGVGCKPRGAGGNAIRVSGNIEVIETQVSFRIPGRVLTRLVDEGDPVNAGQQIAALDDRDLVQQQALRQADVAVARAALLALENGSRTEEIERGKAAVDAANADVERLQADDARQKALFDKEIVSANAYEATHALLAAAQARAREAQQTYILLRKGPRVEDIAQARARLDQATQALAVAQTQLTYASVASPLTGVVLSKTVEPGEVVAAGTPIVTVGDVHNVYLRAYVDETDLGRIKLGQKVRVTTDGQPGKSFEGRLTFISPESEFTPKVVQTQKERVKLVYRIKIDIPSPDQELKPGMPADAEIETTGAK
jgi:HlyD family secretion protein